MKKLCILLCAFLLTGCSGGKDLENRDFVMAVAVEEKNNDFVVYTSVSKLSNKGEDTGTEEILYDGRGKDMTSAFADMNTKTAGDLYLGHTKALIIDNGFTKYDLLINYIKNNVEIGRDVVVVKGDNVSKILEAKPDEMTSASYIYKYFEDKEKKVDIDALIDSFNSAESINIPVTAISGEKLLFNV